jgi:hypothetical protein
MVGGRLLTVSAPARLQLRGNRRPTNTKVLWTLAPGWRILPATRVKGGSQRD